MCTLVLSKPTSTTGLDNNFIVHNSYLMINPEEKSRYSVSSVINNKPSTKNQNYEHCETTINLSVTAQNLISTKTFGRVQKIVC